jgi:cyclic pyranopterin phosphate synthase
MIDSLEDRWQRKINYLRLSLTDRCNYRCAYCMPEDGFEKSQQESLLSFEEIYRLLKLLAKEYGVRKVRLTGGEPLVRAQMIKLVEMIASIEDIQILAITTNGHLLAGFAQSLYANRVRRLNVSIDTFDSKKFKEITRGGDLEAVLKGIQSAQAAGFEDIQINAVVLPKINENEWHLLCTESWDRQLTPRLIELMPIGDLPFQATPISNQKVLEDLKTYFDLKPINASQSILGPAQYFEVQSGKYQGHRLGLINPLSDDGFCATCNRVRLTAQGGLRACLADDREVDLKLALRHNWPDHLLKALIEEGIFGKKPKHLMNEQMPPLSIMTKIGG